MRGTKISLRVLWCPVSRFIWLKRAAGVARDPGGFFEAWRRCPRVLGGWLVGVVS